MIDVDVRLRRASFALDAALTVPPRGITALFGASGCGKTTLLRCIAGLERDCAGTIRVGGETWQDARAFVPSHRRGVGYVFQEPRLFPHLTVAGNLDYGARRARGDGIARDAVVELLGIGALLDRKPARLSGGERQRVAIARALLRKPRVVLMDEPLANLDERRKQEILPFLDRLHAEVAIPIVYVSHSLDEITRLCDHLVVLDAGRVVAAGPLHEVLLRDDLPLPPGEEAGAVVEAEVVAHDDAFGLTELAACGGRLFAPGRSGEVGERLRVRVLARDVSLALERPVASTILNVVPVVINEIHSHPDGGYATLHLTAGTDRLLARVSRRSVESLTLVPGLPAFAQIKGLAVRKDFR